MNSGIVFAGNDGLKTITKGVPPMLATGATSLMKLKFRFVYSAALTAVVETARSSVAVWGRLCHDFGADVAGRTRPAIDEELLAEPLRQPLTDKPRDDVGCTTGREANDDVHWTRRIAERICNASQGRKGRSSGCQVQKFTTGQLHGDVPRV